MEWPVLIFVLGILAGVIAAALVRRARERATIRVLSKFTSSVSHELRTPLAKILLYAETLELDRARNQINRKDAVRIIAQEARHLSYIVENVLLFSRAERKILSIETEMVPLASTIRSVGETFAPLAQERGATLHFNVTERVLVPLHRGALQQIMLNLLENAVKFGPPGQTVVVRTELVAAGRVQVTVEDEGFGIPPAERERVWEPFVRLPPHAGVNGSGIGLAVVRELVVAHGGRCWIEGGRTGGTRVVVELPGADFEGATAQMFPDVYR
ncbi:MAG: HAMP domain-containing sensor histidine kinase [Gemmatimonadota bacterium]